MVKVADEKKEVLDEFLLKNIATWGISSEFFVINYQDEQQFNQLEKSYFKTNQAASIEYLLRSYSLQLMGNPVPDRAEDLQHSTKKTSETMKVKSLKSTKLTTYKKHTMET